MDLVAVGQVCTLDDHRRLRAVAEHVVVVALVAPPGHREPGRGAGRLADVVEELGRQLGPVVVADLVVDLGAVQAVVGAGVVVH